MLTKEVFERGMGEIKVEISKAPFETFKWLLGTSIAVMILILAINKLISV